MNAKQPSPKSDRWIALAGPVIAILGLITYFIVFARFAVLRDFPWVNIPLTLAGFGLSVRALVARRSAWRWVGGSLSALCVAALFGYVFVLSAQLPETANVVAVGAPAPTVTLPNHTGVEMTVPDPARRTLLVFYRGYW